MKILKKATHPIYFVLTLFLGLVIGYRTYTWRHFDNGEPMILVTAVTVMLISMLKDRQFETSSLRTLEDIKKNSKESWDEVTDWIRKHLTPAIISLESHDQVLKHASDIINAALSEPTADNQHVVYVGSGDLLKDPLPTEEADKNSPSMAYQSTMHRVKTNQIKVERYISLLEEDDFKRRIPLTQEAYLKWLDKQSNNLQGNPKYSFWDCPRAPKWGSCRSSIITQQATLDIVGNGQSGVLIRGEQISHALLKGSVDLFFKEPGVKATQYNGAQLAAYKERLHAIIRKPEQEHLPSPPEPIRQ